MPVLPARALRAAALAAREFACHARLRAKERHRARAHEIDAELHVFGELRIAERRAAYHSPREGHAAAGEQAGKAQALAAKGAHLVFHPPGEALERVAAEHEIERLHRAPG